MKRFFLVIFFYLLSPSIDAGDSLSGKAFISNSDYTSVFRFGPFELIETGGHVAGTSALATDFIKSTYRLGGTRIDVFIARLLDANKIDAESSARLAYSAFVTVNRMAGNPPVSRISIYLVPENRLFDISHRSWSIRGRNSVVYPIPVDSFGNYSRELVRNVSHELFHAWVGVRERSQFYNELGAVTMENCAELDAFGFASKLDKTILNQEKINLLTKPGSVERIVLKAKYGQDTRLDQLFIDKVIRKNEPSADLLESLCADRARQALLPDMSGERKP